MCQKDALYQNAQINQDMKVLFVRGVELFQ